MTKTTLVIAGLALALGSAVLAWAAQNEPDRGSPAPPAVPVTRAVAAPPRPAVRAAVPRPTPPPADHAMAEHAAAQDQALQRIVRFDQAFRDEPRDAAWAAQMEPVVRDAVLKNNYPGTRPIDMACKSTFCRIEVEHDDSTGADAFEDIRHHIPGSFYLKNLPAGADGRSRTVAYFLRDERRADNIVYRELR